MLPCVANEGTVCRVCKTTVGSDRTRSEGDWEKNQSAPYVLQRAVINIGVGGKVGIEADCLALNLGGSQGRLAHETSHTGMPRQAEFKFGVTGMGIGMPSPACPFPAITDTPSHRPRRCLRCPGRLFGIPRPASSSHLPVEVVVMGSILLITVSDDVKHIG
ncbi:hypothetical protein GGX14DRAFT_594084 [Mycena pura]|uniref:Uncharacterized protein n=1 Tax=Mycena pura TaxID=153505 RepID=A0AAD6Y5T6_9AGAR|nr:hypothetical protein GGX14DRAFT_594084 [Mycena pura]